MEQTPMLSVPVAGGRQMEPLNWYFAAAACPDAVIVLFCLGGILPPSLLVFLFIYCLLIGPASLVIGIVESVRRRRGPGVHAEPRGMALYPSLIQVRVRRYSYAYFLRIPPVGNIFHAVRDQSVAPLLYSPRPIHRVLTRSYGDSPARGQLSDAHPVGLAPPH